MTPWTALLESLHSAVIDELIEQEPDHKPVLGLPKREKGYCAPQGATQVFRISVEFGTEAAERAKGYVFFAGRGSRLELNLLWEKVVRRAGSEFHRREIRPVFGPCERLEGPDFWDSGTPHPGRTVWIPIEAKLGNIFFGIGAG